MIFTLGDPDSYILPNIRDKNGEILANKIVNVKISHCHAYIYILTQKCLFVYSNDNDFMCLGRFVLSELGNYEYFRDIIVLPTPNLIGLLVDNLKHLLILSSTSTNDTPINSEDELENRIKSPPCLKFIYDIVVPNDFSFFYTIKNQFYFWLHNQSGFYRTIYKNGFLNHIVDSILPDNTPQVINLYLLTTNVLNINIIGNVNFLYSLCYIHLKLNVIDNNLIYKGTRNKIFSHTLDGMITKCVDNINNISEENDFEGLEDQKYNLNASVETKADSTPSKNLRENDSLEIDEVRNIYHTNDNHLYILTTSNLLLCLTVNEKDDENLVVKDTDEDQLPDKLPDKGIVMGKIMCENVKGMCINENRMIFCILFKDNEINTLYNDRIVSRLKFDSEIKSVKWLDDYLFILTSSSIHICTYYLHILYQVNINNGVSELVSSEEFFKSASVLELSNNNSFESQFGNMKVSEPSEADVTPRLHNPDGPSFPDNEVKSTEVVKDIVVIDNKILLFRDKEVLLYDIMNLRNNDKYNVFYNNHSVYLAANYQLSPIYKKSTKSITSKRNKNFTYNIKLNNINHINDIKINSICSYMLIRYNGNNVLLYSNNRTSLVKNDDTRVVSLNFFTNYIYYIVLESGDGYNIVFYNINGKLIEIKFKTEPVKILHDKPYLFVILLSNNVIQTYDLYYINYKLVNTIDIDKLTPTLRDFIELPTESEPFDENEPMDENDSLDKNEAINDNGTINDKENLDENENLDGLEHSYIDKNWIDFHKLTPYDPNKEKDDVYIIMNIYREVYIINNKYIKYLLGNVNQIVHVSNYQYLLTITNDPNTMTVTEEESDCDSGNITPFANTSNLKVGGTTIKSVNTGTGYIVDKTGKLSEVVLNDPNNYILSISDNNLINLMKVNDGIYLYNDVLVYNISNVVNYEKLLLLHLLNNKHRSEILSTNLLSTATLPSDNKSLELVYPHFKKLYYKLFSVLYRKLDNIEDIKGLDEVVKRFSDECSLGLVSDKDLIVDEIFNKLLELKEYNFCSLLLLTLQLKTNPVHTRKKYCNVLIQKLVQEITQVILTGFNTNRFNLNLLNSIITFYNRIYEDSSNENALNDSDKNASNELDKEEHGDENDKNEFSVSETDVRSLSIECVDNDILVNKLIMVNESNLDFNANVLLYNIIKLNHTQII
ncbi:hypothetical protein TpMuguga_03g00352 [Theileria parva strain Muguga]|uniref:uncharacterized protein n=1 Tax=Theileria parva strain Muguga TaxID=333668 RepID=UPI001C61BBCF|nr:uncharacterized protein TpMuguga_03g00352 [Theileria parva strain Muguga]EAN31089.2 hypothetical protein TpMuguga_03g00352 [Theileria parva strain Muguga]